MTFQQQIEFAYNIAEVNSIVNSFFCKYRIKNIIFDDIS